MDVATVVVISTLSALISVSKTNEPTVHIEPKLHSIAKAPEPAASCVATNAARTAGHTSYLQALYGMERVAVVVREAPMGDTLASVFLEPAGAGSSARVVTTTYVDDPDAFTQRLLAGC